jgi:hypothetical protein
VTSRRTLYRGLVALASLGIAMVAIIGLWPVLRFLPGMLAMGWHGGLDTFNGVVLFTLLGLPLAVLCVGVLARLRSGGTPTSWAWRASLGEVGIVYGTAPWLWITVMPGSAVGVFPGRTSLVPLRDLATMGPLGIAGNLLVFAALGFFGPTRFAALASLSRIVLLAAGCSVAVEVAQFVLCLDRVSSVDDVLLNAAGAGLAAMTSRRRWLSAEMGIRPRQDLARAD